MGIRTRAIFSEIEPAHAGAMPAPFAQPGECRVVRDQRLIAAHEQLVLAPDYAWIGDSMRREPSRRDTFERFAPASAEIAMQATRSFERLWRATVAIDRPADAGGDRLAPPRPCRRAAAPRKPAPAIAAATGNHP